MQTENYIKKQHPEISKYYIMRLFYRKTFIVSKSINVFESIFLTQFTVEIKQNLKIFIYIF